MANYYQEGKPLGRRGLFQLITDAAFRDGVLEEREKDILNAVARFLRLDKEVAKEVARKSKRRYQEGTLGVKEPLDPQELYEHVLTYVWSDGKVDPKEEKMLTGLCKILNISDELHEKLSKGMKPQVKTVPTQMAKPEAKIQKPAKAMKKTKPRMGKRSLRSSFPLAIRNYLIAALLCAIGMAVAGKETGFIFGLMLAIPILMMGLYRYVRTPIGFDVTEDNLVVHWRIGGEKKYPWSSFRKIETSERSAPLQWIVCTLDDSSLEFLDAGISETDWNSLGSACEKAIYIASLPEDEDVLADRVVELTRKTLDKLAAEAVKSPLFGASAFFQMTNARVSTAAMQNIRLPINHILVQSAAEKLAKGDAVMTLHLLCQAFYVTEETYEMYPAQFQSFCKIVAAFIVDYKEKVPPGIYPYLKAISDDLTDLNMEPGAGLLKSALIKGCLTS